MKINVKKTATIDNSIGNVLEKIHDEVYSKASQKIIEVFLCGGASNKKCISIRDSVRDDLSNDSSIRILYPEDLFIEMLNTNRTQNLLELENFLADNCDIICIICESAGSLVELGAFTNNTQMFDKVIAVLDQRRKKKKSFIMLGPVRQIQRKHKDHVIFYSKDDISALSNTLKKYFASQLNKKSTLEGGKKGRAINSIIGLYYFIPVLLYFFKFLEYELLNEYLVYLFLNYNYSTDKFNILLNSSIKLLYKDKYIQKTTINSNSRYELTTKGYKNVFNILRNASISDKNALYDQIRFAIIRRKYYK